MSGKPRLHYFNGRGRMESIRWLLAAAGVEFEESFLEKKEDLTKLQKDGSLLFQQVPMVEIDGMKLVQTRAIANYIATKYNLYGKDMKERALIDMYVEGMFDLNELLMTYEIQPADKKEQHFANMMDKAENRYFPVFEKVLKDHGKDFLVGNQLSRADVQLLEVILMVEEWKPDIFVKFPVLQIPGNQARGNMSGKPRLHYFNGRGRMEPIRWLLAAAGVEFEESFLEKKEDLTKLQKDGSLLFQQVPMVEIDGMKLVQTRAIANYVATKYNLYGKDMKERALIDMYVEGMFDLYELLIMYFIQPADKKQEHFANMMDKAENRYFPVFEKVLKDHGKDFLVGNQLSRADVQLLEVILMAEEYKPDTLAKFPLLQSFKARISNIPTIKKFLQPGSQRKPRTTEEDVARAMKIFRS
ncbi:glutathione S-transferase-like isoform X1 [Agelaius tricolor]